MWHFIIFCLPKTKDITCWVKILFGVSVYVRVANFTTKFQGVWNISKSFFKRSENFSNLVIKKCFEGWYCNRITGVWENSDQTLTVFWRKKGVQNKFHQSKKCSKWVPGWATSATTRMIVLISYKYFQALYKCFTPRRGRRRQKAMKAVLYHLRCLLQSMTEYPLV